MPTDADARPKDHSDNSTQAEGSQLRSIHGGLRGWPISSETKMRASPSTSCEQPKLPTPPPFELACVELRALAITPLEFPITPLRITVAMAQPRRHLPTVPTSLLALSGPTRWCANAIPALPSPGTAELSHRASAAGVVRAEEVCVRCSGRAVTWLAQPTGTRSAQMLFTYSGAARGSRRSNGDRRYDHCGNCCGSEDWTHSCRSPTVSLYTR